MTNELYQELILDHSRQPRNFGSLHTANRMACGDNPLCGDRCRVFLREEGGRIQEISFEGNGCAISTSSASLMTQALKGKTVAEAELMSRQFLDLLRREAAGDAEDLGKLAVFAGVRDYPVRVKCATLAWHTLRAALHGTQEVVSTE